MSAIQFVIVYFLGFISPYVIIFLWKKYDRWNAARIQKINTTDCPDCPHGIRYHP